jgi:serine/threonine-protein kinase HipA
MNENRCRFTYKNLEKGYYSEEGLKKLKAGLKGLELLPYTLEEQRKEVQKHSGKISIQGVQPKLSAKLSVKDKSFELVERDGEYIIKPQVHAYPELPQNEDLTMHLAQISGLNVPWHGLIEAKDHSLLYVIKRFDRLPKKQKLPQEDFAQLAGATRTTKYQANMEKVCEIVEEFCSFPTVELEIIFKMTLFSFLIGNEDMHLKNFSLQTTPKKIIKLTPVYDLVNSSIAFEDAKEEMALELNGKKHGFVKNDFIKYFGPECCYVSKERSEKILNQLLSKVPIFEDWIKRSFLTKGMQEKYSALLKERATRLKQ